MGDGFQFLDIIFFAMVAGFILLRLRSALGRRTGHERPPNNPLANRQAEETNDNVVQLPDHEAVPDEPADDFSDVDDSVLAAGLAQVKSADPGFTRQGFLEGARGAFEIVVDAFAAGDTERLRGLLDDDVYRPFSRAIKDRENADQTLDSALVSIDEADIIEAGMNGRVAFVTVRVVSKQINVTHDRDGNVVDGDAAHEVAVTDLWTFDRDTRSRNPNWKLAATRSPN
ncbi:MAG: Tim44/TimA family putative adaptor protein [Alphaproteobacteria bacterium]|jgi:predicted lipid-binding transport protein (Tim44 family)